MGLQTKLSQDEWSASNYYRSSPLILLVVAVDVDNFNFLAPEVDDSFCRCDTAS